MNYDPRATAIYDNGFQVMYIFPKRCMIEYCC